MGSGKLEWRGGTIKFSAKNTNNNLMKVEICACKGLLTKNVERDSCFSCMTKGQELRIKTITWVVKEALKLAYDKSIYENVINSLANLVEVTHKNPLAQPRHSDATDLVKSLVAYLLRHLPVYSKYWDSGNGYKIAKPTSDAVEALRLSQDFFKWNNPMEAIAITSPPTLGYYNFVETTICKFGSKEDIMKFYSKMGKIMGKFGSGPSEDGIPAFVLCYRKSFRTYFDEPKIDEPRPIRDLNSMKQEFADICLAYGKAIGLGKENIQVISQWIPKLRNDDDSTKEMTPLNCYEDLVNLSEQILALLVEESYGGEDNLRHLKRLLYNHVSQHRARISLLRGHLDDSKTELNRLCDKLVDDKEQKRPKLLLEQVLPLTAECYLALGEYTDLQEKCQTIKDCLSNESDKEYLEMWLQYIAFKQRLARESEEGLLQTQLNNIDLEATDTTVNGDAELLIKLEQKFRAQRNNWDLALVLQIQGEQSKSIEKLQEARDAYDRIPSHLHSALVTAEIIKLCVQKGESGDQLGFWEQSKEVLSHYPLYGTLIKSIDELMQVEIPDMIDNWIDYSQCE